MRSATKLGVYFVRRRQGTVPRGEPSCQCQTLLLALTLHTDARSQMLTSSGRGRTIAIAPMTAPSECEHFAWSRERAKNCWPELRESRLQLWGQVRPAGWLSQESSPWTHWWSWAWRLQNCSSNHG